MIHFEEIWTDFDCNIDCGRGQYCTTCGEVAKHFYKKALEWVLDEYKKYDEIQEEIDGL